MTEDDPNFGKPPYDEDLAADLIGKYILVGLTYQDKQGNFLYQKQLHGVIIAAAPNGITIALRGVNNGETWIMPPDLSNIEPANPGTYTLKSTNEVVENPDFYSNWFVNRPHLH
jgi:hypothetical protein